MIRNFVAYLPVFLASTWAYSFYQERIPNARLVQHPCKVNYRWSGVGHINPKGGGERNVFGLDFQTHGHNWNSQLCSRDSDGDGLTNGQELGDPDCVWSPGQLPSRIVNITHPGVCDPYGSPRCSGKNDFVSCSLDAFENCNVTKNPDVTNKDFRFKKFQLPARETNYYCMTFDLDVAADQHIVANEPLIDNQNVLHHIQVFGCVEDYDFSIDSPQPCGMSVRGCPFLIGGWTVGVSGLCFGPKAGYRIGPTGYKKIALLIHYNNPELVSDYTDESGIRIYIQPVKPEVQDMVTFATGQGLLNIPPGKSRVPHVGVCPSYCTNMTMTKPVYVALALNHMHYLGQSMKVELFRNGVVIANITNDELYSYDSPSIHSYDPPIEIRPGDEIKTTCVYNSLSTDRYTYFGEATSDEMCDAFLSVYPGDAFMDFAFNCGSSGPVSSCDIKLGRPVEGCDWKAFLSYGDPNTTNIVEELAENCDLKGFCRPECRNYLETIKNHPCLNGEMSTFTKTRMTYTYSGMKFLAYLNSCNQQLPWTPSADTTVSFSAILLFLTTVFSVLA